MVVLYRKVLLPDGVAWKPRLLAGIHCLRHGTFTIIYLSVLKIQYITFKLQKLL